MHFLFLLCLCVGTLFAQHISIASYNVENLFDAKVEGSEYPDFMPGRFGWDEAMARTKYLHTKRIIKHIDADIIALQEIENEELLQALAKDLHYAYFAFTKTKGSPVGVGVLSRYTIRSQKALSTGIEKTRDLLHVRLQTPREDLNLWVNHWPSLKQPPEVRMKVADTLQKALKETKEPTLLVGDFNTPHSTDSPLKKYFLDKGWYEPWFELPLENRWSHDFFGKKSALDRMLVSPALRDGKDLEYIFPSFEIVAPAYALNKNGKPKRWERENKGKGRHLGEGYSDHLPISIKLSTFAHHQTSSRVTLERLFSLPEGTLDVSLRRAVVSYAHKDGFVLSQDGRGIYVYRPGFSLKPGSVVDVRITRLKDYHGMKEITALHVTRTYADVVRPESAMLLASRLKDARPGDVIKEIHGEVRGKMFHTQYGDIRLYAKDPKRMPRFGMRVTLKQVRVGVYHGKNELILEERE